MRKLFPTKSKKFGDRLNVLMSRENLSGLDLAAKLLGYSEKPKSNTEEYEECRKKERTIKNHLKLNALDNLNSSESLSTIYLIEYCNFFHCSADYLLGFIDFPTKENQNIHDITGLNDISIEMLKFLSTNNGVTQSGHNEMEVLNIFLSDMDFVLKFLGGLQDFINARYKIPIYHTGKHEVINGCFQPQCVVPDNEYDTIGNIPLLTLAKTKENPQDNYSIPLTDTFFESIALKTIEESIIDLRNKLNQKSDVNKTTR